MISAAFKGAGRFCWTRHRSLIVGAALIYLAIFAAHDASWARDGQPFVLQMLTFLRAAPLFLPLLVFTSAGSVATKDLATPDSWFPGHLFTLPVTTRELVLPFMTYAVVAHAVLWGVAVALTQGRVLVAEFLGPPSGAPSSSPFLQLALLVWVQALAWTPFRQRWWRPTLLFCVVAAYFVLLFVAINGAVPTGAVIALCLVQLPIAYWAAERGVARARHAGSRRAERSRGVRAGALREAALPARRRFSRPFASRHDALAWFESCVQRGKGKWVTVFLISLVLGVQLLGNLAGRAGGADSRALALAGIGLLTSMLVVIGLTTGTSFAAFTTSTHSYRNDAFRMPSFFAALPASSGHFAWAKLEAAAKRMALITVVVLAASAGIAVLTGLDASWAAFFAPFRAQHGAFESAAVLVLAPIAFVLAAAVGTANLVWLGLAGRGWIAAQVLTAFLVLAVIVLPAWIGDPARLRAFLDALPTLLRAAAAAKLAALALLVYLVGSRGLYSWSRIGAIVGGWAAAVAACLALYVRYAPWHGHLLTSAAGVMLVAPVIGLLAAPLMLQWNRTR